MTVMVTFFRFYWPTAFWYLRDNKFVYKTEPFGMCMSVYVDGEKGGRKFKKFMLENLPVGGITDIAEIKDDEDSLGAEFTGIPLELLK